jgi:hypothetical protein
LRDDKGQGGTNSATNRAWRNWLDLIIYKLKSLNKYNFERNIKESTGKIKITFNHKILLCLNVNLLKKVSFL